MNPNINNGMQQQLEYNHLKGQLDANQSYFLVLQLIQRTVKKQGQESKGMTMVKTYDIDLVITNLQVFYNRTLLQRAQSFMNQATINRVQNAQAEADFDDKVEKFKQDTE